VPACHTHQRPRWCRITTPEEQQGQQGQRIEQRYTYITFLVGRHTRFGEQQIVEHDEGVVTRLAFSIALVLEQGLEVGQSGVHLEHGLTLVLRQELHMVRLSLLNGERYQCNAQGPPKAPHEVEHPNAHTQLCTRNGLQTDGTDWRIQKGSGTKEADRQPQQCGRWGLHGDGGQLQDDPDGDAEAPDQQQAGIDRIAQLPTQHSYYAPGNGPRGEQQPGL